MSASACRECKPEEINLYDCINIVLKRLETNGGEVDKTKIPKAEISEISRIYAEIKACDNRYSDDLHEKTKESLQILFDQFSHEDLETVLIQRDNLGLVKWCVVQNSNILDEYF